jgi:hypothetical protein
MEIENVLTETIMNANNFILNVLRVKSFIKNTRVPRIVKKLHVFYGNIGSLSCSQQYVPETHPERPGFSDFTNRSSYLASTGKDA